MRQTSPFAPRFDQLAVYENLRTPLLLLEEEYNRAKACWAACEGLSTDILENIVTVGDTLAGRFSLRDESERQLIEQRDELCKTLEVLVGAVLWGHGIKAPHNLSSLGRSLTKARAAIAKATQPTGRKD